MEILSKNLVVNVICAALSKGASFAEVFVEHSSKNSMRLTNGNVDEAVSGIDFGMGIRIFDGFGAVYTYTNNLSEENLLKIAKEAALAVKNNQYTTKFSGVIEASYKAICRPFDSRPEKKYITNLLKSASNKSFEFSKEITQTQGSYEDISQHVLIANSEGLWAEDTRDLLTFAISAVATSGTEKQTGYFRKGSRVGLEFLESLNFEELGERSAEQAVKMLHADLCPAGVMPVVIDNAFGGVIFHEACGHSLEATSVAKGASEFCGKMGMQIANEKVTAIDDGTIENAWGSLNFDDEGTPTKRNVLIKNGILKSYLVDKLNGLKMNTEPTGSSRRQNYRFAPTSRMTNTYIDKGQDKFEDMIESIDNGLYAKIMGGGSVQPATGEFNFAVTEGYLIEKGKITKPVRGATLIGKGANVLMDIEMVSDNLSMEAGFCGSLSGAVPTNVGQPAIKVKKMTVGGRN